MERKIKLYLMQANYDIEPIKHIDQIIVTCIPLVINDYISIAEII